MSKNPYCLPVVRVGDEAPVIYPCNMPDCEQVLTLRRKFEARYKGTRNAKKIPMSTRSTGAK